MMPVTSPKICFFSYLAIVLSSGHFPFLVFKVTVTLVSMCMKGSLKEIPAVSLKITGYTFLCFRK